MNLFFLSSKEDGPTDRIFNLDLLAMAAPSPENPEWTFVVCGIANITIHIPFADFLSKMENHIADKYRVEMENSAKWHNKRVVDSEQTMRSVMAEFIGKHL